MTSIYQNKEFAEYWNKRAGETGEVYKRLILDPMMFRLVSSFLNKTVLELGCGNGYLAQKFLNNNVRKLILADISKYNLAYARKRTTSKKVVYLEQNLTKKWKISSSTVDIVYSNMMLNEIANIKTPVSESFRVLKKGGKFIFSVTHPAWDLYLFAQEKIGLKSKKIINVGNYFTRGHAQFIMGSDNAESQLLAKETHQKFKVEHYQRPVSDYVNALLDAGFTIKRMAEPQVTKALLKHSPRFKKDSDQPLSLVLYSIKT